MTETFLCNNADTNYKVACCLNYFYSQKERKCVPCSDGYYGYNCNKTCPAGFYGSSCTSQCICDIDKCDFRYGCESQVTTEASKTTVAITTEIEYTSKKEDTPPPSTVNHLSSQISSSESQEYATIITDTHLRKSTHIPVTIVTETSPLQITLNSNTILIGIGGLISVLLIVIIIQRCFKSKSKKRQISTKNKIIERHSDIETSLDKSKISKSSLRDSEREKYHELRGSTNDVTNEPQEYHYQELDQCLEVINLTSSMIVLPASAQTAYAEPVENNTYIVPFSSEENDNKLQSKDPNIEPVGKLASNKQPHTYIDIIELPIDGDKFCLKDTVRLQFSSSENLDFNDKPGQRLNDTYLNPINSYKPHSL